MDNKEHILDVSISALKWEMWLTARKPPVCELQFKNWVEGKTTEEMTDIFRRTPGLIASMADIPGDFWQELQARIDFRVEREKQDIQKIRTAALEPPPLPIWKTILGKFKCLTRKNEGE